MKVNGVWLPIVTPFLNDEIDFDAYEKLIHYYLPKGISGLIPMGTTGESPTIKTAEFEMIIAKTLEIVDNRMPVYVGIGGNDTRKVIETLKVAGKYSINGILSVCPYYNRPDQNGLFQHFVRLSENTDLNIIIYNIPYRTGVNLQNETLLRLAEHANIIAVKDSCGDIRQSLDLLLHKPENFSVLTGEDHLFFTTIANGGDGGILASAHLNTKDFVLIYGLLKQNDFQAALDIWKKISPSIPLLFKEPNPAPLKYCLNQLNLIRSAQTRLPLTAISDQLKKELDQNLSL